MRTSSLQGFDWIEEDYKKSAKGGIIRGRECLAIATILNINKEALTAALEHLSVLFICPPKGSPFQSQCTVFKVRCLGPSAWE